MLQLSYPVFFRFPVLIDPLTHRQRLRLRIRRIFSILPFTIYYYRDFHPSPHLRYLSLLSVALVLMVSVLYVYIVASILQCLNPPPPPTHS